MSKAWWLGIGLIVACGGAEPTDDDTDTDVAETDDTDGGDGSTLTGDVDAILALEADVTAGQAGYGTNCVLCHQADGTGTGAFPDITGSDARTIVETMIEGPGTMTSAEDLGLVDQDVADIAAYAETL